MEQSIETFYKSVAQSPALLSQLTAGVQTPDEFIDRAVALAAEQGHPFSREEASKWINDQIAARKNGELSDVQLEGVAGGKDSVGDSASKVYEAEKQLVNTTVNLATDGANSVASWFSSW